MKLKNNSKSFKMLKIRLIVIIKSNKKKHKNYKIRSKNKMIKLSHYEFYQIIIINKFSKNKNKQ